MNIQTLADFYESFSMESIESLADIYDADVTFKDPLHEITGIASLKRYFLHVCNSSVSFEITDAFEARDSDGLGVMRWVMAYSHPDLAKGRELSLTGCSYIRFGGKVSLHEDFYDLGAMVYRHLPILGFAVGKVNNRLKGGVE